MKVAFETLSPQSRIWIFQASVPVSNETVAHIQSAADDFVAQWTAHNLDLKAAVKFIDNIFLVFGVDESLNDASGCSIDKLTAFVKAMEHKYDIEFFNRMNIAFQSDSGIQICSFAAFSDLLKSNAVNNSTIVYNNLVDSKGAFDKNWKVPLEDSWHLNLVASN